MRPNHSSHDACFLVRRDTQQLKNTNVSDRVSSKEKIKEGQGNRECRYACALCMGHSFYKTALQRDWKEVKGKLPGDLGEELLGRGDHKCKGPNEGASFVCLMNSNGVGRVGKSDGR